jgi:hypothetical protein
MYYWYKMAFFDETSEDKYEAETISVDNIVFIFIFKINPIRVVLNNN